MSDTFFTASPHWGGWVVLYFFVGGIAGGSLVLAGLLHLVGQAEDRPVVRMGYWVALIGAVISGALLTIDLTRPLRFWHMLIQSETGLPIMKAWSPISVGAWGLLAFSAVAGLGGLGALGEVRARWSRFGAMARGVPGILTALLAIPAGLFLAGYTGVLLAVTNRPVWADSLWLGPLFLFSGLSAALAFLALAGRNHASSTTLDRMHRVDRPMLLLELIALAVFLVSLGPVVRVWLGLGGAVLALGVVGAGILVPLGLLGRGRAGEPPTRMALVLVIAGSFLLRLVILTTSESIHAVGSGVAGG